MVNRRRSLATGSVVAVLATTAGCNGVLGLGDYREANGADAGAAGSPGGCSVDLTQACLPAECAPATERELLNACTTAACVPFDDATRVPLLQDGGLPPLPPFDAGSDDGAAGGSGDGGSASEAGAPPPCDAINGNPIVYVQGTAKSYVAALGRALFADAEPVTIVWRGMSSCFAWSQLLNGESIDTEPGAPTGAYWDPSSSTPDNERQCSFPASAPGGGPLVADVTVTDLFATSCFDLSNGLPSDVGDFFGPVQTMAFVVPKASQQRAISAPAAYFVYGFGGDGGVAPWLDDGAIFRLADESGTQRIIAAGIGVESARWKGTDVDNTSKMIPKISSPAAGTEQKTLGILAYTNISDTLRTQIEILAYRHFGQERCGYYPDSTETSSDKRNVRDGHFALWGPLHFSTKLDANGFARNPNARRAINVWTGVTSPPAGLDLIQVASVNNLVPTCAMRVRRTSEMGALQPSSPDNACGCYFEKVATGTTGCTACASATECPSDAPKCNYGFCEAR